MDVREKLVGLLKEADRKAYEVAESRQLTHPFEVWEIQADHLIANGVTVQEWISVKDRLPEEKGDVIVCDTREDFVATWEYLGNGLWLYDNIFWDTDDITHWMPLPQPPKGE